MVFVPNVSSSHPDFSRNYNHILCQPLELTLLHSRCPSLHLEVMFAEDLRSRCRMLQMVSPVLKKVHLQGIHVSRRGSDTEVQTSLQSAGFDLAELEMDFKPLHGDSIIITDLRLVRNSTQEATGTA